MKIANENQNTQLKVAYENQNKEKNFVYEALHCTFFITFITAHKNSGGRSVKEEQTSQTKLY